MVKKVISDMENSVGVSDADALDNTENEFDLKVLEKDIEEHTKKTKEAYNKRLIEQANIQKDVSEIQEIEEKEQDFNEAFQEILDFIFDTINRRLSKMDISTFDSAFIEKFTNKLIGVIPKRSLEKAKDLLGGGNKAKSGIKLYKIANLLMFLSKEVYKRIDEYIVFRDAKKLTKEPDVN